MARAMLLEEGAGPTRRRVLLVATQPKHDELVRKFFQRTGSVQLGTMALLGRSFFGPAGEALGMGISRVHRHYVDRQADVEAQALAALTSSEFLSPTLGMVATELSIPHLDPVAATSRFVFIPGHPVDGTVYGLLPSSHDRYVPLAQLDELEKQRRLGGCKALLGALGARTVEVVSSDSALSAGEGSVGVAIPSKSADGLVQAAKSGTTSRRIFAEFGPPRRAPYVPEKHRVWLDGDAALAALCENRLEHSLLRDEFTFQTARDSRISADVCAGFSNLGFAVGGAYQTVRVETWRCEATFWPWLGT